MLGDMAKVSIGRQDREVVTDAKLRQQCVDRTDLNAAPATSVSQLGGVDVVLPCRHQKRQCREAIEDPLGRSGPAEPCRSSCRTKPVVSSASPASIARINSRTSGAEEGASQRNASDDEQAQLRERPAL
jgi:hypothetical protein